METTHSGCHKFILRINKWPQRKATATATLHGGQRHPVTLSAEMVKSLRITFLSSFCVSSLSTFAACQ